MKKTDQMANDSADERWMRRALDLAAKGLGSTRPNPCVGAVIVGANGTIPGEGFHQRAGMPHAEVEALNDAKARDHEVRGATMYVTLEPCNHTGRTGPCTEAIIKAGIGRVVIAARDPNLEARGGVERLREAGVEVVHGVLAGESKLLNAPFFIFHELGRPMVTLKWAMTLDGCTSVESGDSKWITGPEARREVHRRRTRHDAILIGIETLLRDNAVLTPRDVPIPPGPPLVRIVLDSSLRMPLDAAYIQEKTDCPALVLCAEEADREKEQQLRDQGVDVLRVKRGDQSLSLPDVIWHLKDRGIQSIYVEGGRTVAGQFLRYGLVDRVEAWIAPKISGGGTMHLGPTKRTPAIEAMELATQLERVQSVSFGKDILVEGWIPDSINRLDPS